MYKKPFCLHPFTLFSYFFFSFVYQIYKKMVYFLRYLYEMLPGSARPEPDALTLENARKVVDRILKVKIQASRFRAKYNQFPKASITISLISEFLYT